MVEVGVHYTSYAGVEPLDVGDPERAHIFYRREVADELAFVEHGDEKRLYRAYILPLHNPELGDV